MPRTPGCRLLVILGVLLVLCGLVTLPPLALERNPPVQQEPPWDSPQTRTLAQRACFDCHSNQTNWPWFAQIPPGSWLAVFDTVRGRQHLNFSEWGTARAGGEGGERAEGGERRGGRGGGGEMAEVIRNGSMPPNTYLMLHPEARLSAAEQQQLIQGLQASLRAGG